MSPDIDDDLSTASLTASGAAMANARFSVLLSGYDTYLSRCHGVIARANLLIDPPCLAVTAPIMCCASTHVIFCTFFNRTRVKIQSVGLYTTVPRDSRYTVNIRAPGGEHRGAPPVF